METQLKGLENGSASSMSPKSQSYRIKKVDARWDDEEREELVQPVHKGSGATAARPDQGADAPEQRQLCTPADDLFPLAPLVYLILGVLICHVLRYLAHFPADLEIFITFRLNICRGGR